MREAVGGVGLIHIVAVFLIVYIGFMAIVLNYGRIFRIKNNIINTIEQNEGVYELGDISSSNPGDDSLYGIAKQHGYGSYVNGCQYSNENRGTSYSVTIYINFALPLIHKPLSIPVKGETRFIEQNVNSTRKPSILPECGV